MARFLFFMFLAVFMAVGVLCFFFMNVKLLSAVSGNKETSEEYSDFILKDDFNLRSVLARVASACSRGDLECVAVKAFVYVKNDIALLEKGEGGRFPKRTLTSRGGDAADKAVLLASFLENGGIRTEIRDRGGRPVVYAAGLDVLHLYEAIIKDMHDKPLAERNITLKKGGIWAVNLGSAREKPIPVDISAKSSGVFDMLLFPDETEMKAYLRDKNGRFISDCSLFGVSEAEVSCLSPSGGKLFFISLTDGATFLGSVYKGGVILSDIKSEESPKGSLIPMDVAFSSDMAYPGIVP